MRSVTPRRKTEFPLRGGTNIDADSNNSPNRQPLKARQSSTLTDTHSFRYQSTPLRDSKSRIQYDDEDDDDDQVAHATLSMTFQKFRVSKNPLFSRCKSTCIKNTSSMPDKGRWHWKREMFSLWLRWCLGNDFVFIFQTVPCLNAMIYASRPPFVNGEPLLKMEAWISLKKQWAYDIFCFTEGADSSVQRKGPTVRASRRWVKQHRASSNVSAHRRTSSLQQHHLCINDADLAFPEIASWRTSRRSLYLIRRIIHDCANHVLNDYTVIFLIWIKALL